MSLHCAALAVVTQRLLRQVDSGVSSLLDHPQWRFDDVVLHGVYEKMRTQTACVRGTRRRCSLQDCAIANLQKTWRQIPGIEFVQGSRAAGDSGQAVSGHTRASLRSIWASLRHEGNMTQLTFDCDILIWAVDDKGARSYFSSLASLWRATCRSSGSDRERAAAAIACLANSDFALRRDLHSVLSRPQLAVPSSVARQPHRFESSGTYSRQAMGIAACPGWAAHCPDAICLWCNTSQHSLRRAFHPANRWAHCGRVCVRSVNTL